MGFGPIVEGSSPSPPAINIEMNVSGVILAAGKGTRMKSNIPKVLHPVSGKKLVLYALEKLVVFLYEQLKEFFFPTPQIPEEVYEQICKDASDFVWAKHRPWDYDDMFAEYLCLVNDMCIEKWNEMYEMNK